MRKEKEEQKKQEQESEDEDEDQFLQDAPKYYQPGIVPQAPLKPS